ncbi:MAG: histidinol-phosphatase [Candidatus Zixiibacteriota bacterium]|nr:MAG: histidinol-phosphatase [candidate division Zixibacteria bacterium]
MKSINYPLADYHVHPDFSFDATGSVDDYCRTAVEKRLAEICFTTHFDTNPVLPESSRSITVAGKAIHHSIENLQPYVDAVEKAREEFYPLMVKCGIEVGYYPGCEKETSELFQKYRFDYRLGAVHEVDDFDLCREEYFLAMHSKVSLETLVDRYFALVGKAVESGLFDAIAHLDLYKRFGVKYYGREVSIIHREKLAPVFEAMVEHNIGMELNTSGLRKGAGEYYPSMDIVNMGRKAGVGITTIGSDAHRPEHLAYDFDTAALIAHELFPYISE